MTHTRLARWQRAIIFVLTGGAMIGYFAYHAFQGNYGIFAQERLEAQVAQLSADLAQVTAERKALQHQVMLLSSQTIDPDLLEERVRETLNLAHPNDVVIVERTPGAH